MHHAQREHQDHLAQTGGLALTPDVAWEYGKAFRYLRGDGRLIGANDLWIAAAGLAYGMGVITRNVERYRRVPGLEVVSY